MPLFARQRAEDSEDNESGDIVETRYILADCNGVIWEEQFVLRGGVKDLICLRRRDGLELRKNMVSWYGGRPTDDPSFPFGAELFSCLKDKDKWEVINLADEKIPLEGRGVLHM